MKKKIANRVVAFALSFTLVLALFAPIGVSASAAEWQEVLDSPFFGPMRDGGGDFEGQIATDEGILIDRTGRPGDAQWQNNLGVAINIAALRTAYGGTPEIVIEGRMLLEGVSHPPTHMNLVGVGSYGVDGVGGTMPSGNINPETGEFRIVVPGNLSINIPGWASGDGNTLPFTASSRNQSPAPFLNPNYIITNITVGSLSIFQLLAGDIEVPEEETIDFGFPAGIIYSLLLDGFIGDLAQGSEVAFGDIPAFGSSGTATYTVVGNPFGGNAIRVTGRASDYSALDFQWRVFNLADGRYTIQVIGNIELEDAFDPATFATAGSSSPWGWIGEDAFPDETTGDFEMVRSFEVIDGEIVDDINDAIGGNIRLLTPAFTNNYTIYQVVLIEAGGELPELPARVAVVPVEPVTPPTVEPVDPVEPVVPVTGDGLSIVLTIGSDIAMINGVATPLDDPAFLSADGRTMVPLRFVATALGATVRWQAPFAIIEHPAVGVMQLEQGVQLPDNLGTTENRDGRIFVPFRFIANAFGATTAWDRDAQTVTITLDDAS